MNCILYIHCHIINKIICDLNIQFGMLNNLICIYIYEPEPCIAYNETSVCLNRQCIVSGFLNGAWMVMEKCIRSLVWIILQCIYTKVVKLNDESN